MLLRHGQLIEYETVSSCQCCKAAVRDSKRCSCLIGCFTDEDCDTWALGYRRHTTIQCQIPLGRLPAGSLDWFRALTRERIWGDAASVLLWQHLQLIEAAINSAASLNQL